VECVHVATTVLHQLKHVLRMLLTAAMLWWCHKNRILIWFPKEGNSKQTNPTHTVYWWQTGQVKSTPHCCSLNSNITYPNALPPPTGGHGFKHHLSHIIYFYKTFLRPSHKWMNNALEWATLTFMSYTMWCQNYEPSPLSKRPAHYFALWPVFSASHCSSTKVIFQCRMIISNL
jgi:hypothetical protein